MKKSIFSYFSYLVVMLLAVGTLSSCDGTETEGVDPAPTITVDPDGSTIDVGQSVDFTYVVASTESRLDEIRIIYPGQDDQIVTDFSDNNLYTGVYTFTGMEADAGNSVSFRIEARDRDGALARKEVTVNVNAVVIPVDPVAFEEFPVILLGAQGNADLGSFLDADAGTTYKIAGARSNTALIDMAYLQGSQSNGQGAVIGSLTDASVESVFSTNESTWGSRNDTRFRNTTLTAAEFGAITDGAPIQAAYASGTEPNIGTTGDIREGSSSRVNQLSVDNVFAFRTSDGKDGLVHVQSIDAGETGSITLNVKIVTE